MVARRFWVRGKVQGVGFRYFVERAAAELGLRGYARNLANGDVEVYAVGPRQKLEELAVRLWQGPRWADVRGVEQKEDSVVEYESFRIE